MSTLLQTTKYHFVKLLCLWLQFGFGVWICLFAAHLTTVAVRCPAAGHRHVMSAVSTACIRTRRPKRLFLSYRQLLLLKRATYLREIRPRVTLNQRCGKGGAQGACAPSFFAEKPYTS